jgi:hypothetical protein
VCFVRAYDQFFAFELEWVGEDAAEDICDVERVQYFVNEEGIRVASDYTRELFLFQIVEKLGHAWIELSFSDYITDLLLSNATFVELIIDLSQSLCTSCINWFHLVVITAYSRCAGNLLPSNNSYIIVSELQLISVESKSNTNNRFFYRPYIKNYNKHTISCKDVQVDRHDLLTNINYRLYEFTQFMRDIYVCR